MQGTLKHFEGSQEQVAQLIAQGGYKLLRPICTDCNGLGLNVYGPCRRCNKTGALFMAYGLG